jgi:hypothetical protein
LTLLKTAGRLKVSVATPSAREKSRDWESDMEKNSGEPLG